MGIGGPIEPDEINDPTAAALRELDEEVGVTSDDITDLSLRYLAVRDTGTELRHTYYFSATLKPHALVRTYCPEGELRWFDLEMDSTSLEMPPTAHVAFGHWLRNGRFDQTFRFIVIDQDDQRTGPI